MLQAFLQQGHKLISCSKDSHVRVWDLSTQHCSQTLVGYRGEVWALALDPTQTRLVTGSADVDLQVYQVLSHEAAEEEAAAAGQHDTLRSLGRFNARCCVCIHMSHSPSAVSPSYWVRAVVCGVCCTYRERSQGGLGSSMHQFCVLTPPLCLISSCPSCSNGWTAHLHMRVF